MGLLKITIVALLLTSSWSFSNVSFADGRLVNIATRGFVGDENDVLIAGFIIDDSSKKVLIRARGPSLAQADPNLTGLLNNPLVQLFNSSGQLIETNDDWQTRSNSGDIDPALSPTDSREAAILISLDPGAYTAIVRGVGGTTGIGIVEVFNRDPKQIDTGGIWNGTSTSNQGFPNQQLSMITTPDGRFAAISLTTGAQFVGNIGSTNDEQSRFSATWELPATGESGTLNFEYDPIHQRDSSAEIFQGEWVTLAELALDQASGRILAQGTIDARFDFADGFFSGIDEFNCQYQGNILTRSTNFNIYNISVRVSGCEFSGNYTGLGAIIDLQSQSGAILSNRGLVFAVDNGTNYLTDVLFKN